MRHWINLITESMSEPVLLKDGSKVILKSWEDDPEGLVHVWIEQNGEEIGSGTYNPETESFTSIEVHADYRRNGVATAIYDFIEGCGYHIKPSNAVQPDGWAFWNARDGLKKSRPMPKLKEAFGTTEKLFHGTNLDNLWLIFKDGKLTPNVHGRDYAGPEGVCLTRSFKVATDHAGSWADNLNGSFFEYFGIEPRHDFAGTVVLEFDRNRIREKIVPYDDFGADEHSEDGGIEQEERVLGDLSLDALTGIYVRKGELEEFLKHAAEANAKHGDAAEYNEQFQAIIHNVLADPRLKTY